MATTTSTPTPDSCSGRPPKKHKRKRVLFQYTCLSCSTIYDQLHSAWFPSVLKARAEAKLTVINCRDVAIFSKPGHGLYRACSTCGEQEDIVRHCPECQSIDIVEDPKTDTTTCQSCGLVLLGPPPLFVGGYYFIRYGWGGATLDTSTR